MYVYVMYAYMYIYMSNLIFICIHIPYVHIYIHIAKKAQVVMQLVISIDVVGFPRPRFAAEVESHIGSQEGFVVSEL